MKSFLKLFSNSAEVQKRLALPALSDIGDIQGKKVLLRAALNVPVKNGLVTNLYRLERAIPSIKYLQDRGAKVVVIGHMGRELTDTLQSVYNELNKSVAIKWGGSLKDGSRAIVDELQSGEAVLFENLRQDPREKANDADFARELAGLADLYVNDAFADSHREHTSIVGVPLHLPTYFGLNFIREYEGLLPALQPHSPSLVIIGGAKFETKLPLIQCFANRYDHIVVGGALANDVYQAKGYEVGRSLISEIDLRETDLLDNPKVLVPNHVLAANLDNREQREVTADKVRADESIVDAGVAGVEELRPLVEHAKTILWNGPLGNYELGYKTATEVLAKLISESSAYSIVGGGDTVASIESLSLSERFGFLSTAGGAMLTFLETETLPAIEVVLKK